MACFASMKTLGHILQSDGGVDQDFDATISQMWKSYFANCASWVGKHFPWGVRIKLIKRAVEPILRFHCPRWPYGVDIARQLDALQRRMYTIALQLPMLDTEEIDDFVRRRGRTVAALQREHGCWSNLWVRLLRSWRDHLGRPANRYTWAAIVEGIMTPADLELRRVHSGHRGTGTRALPGFIRKRWYESVENL